MVRAPRMILYLRVSTDEQVIAGNGLDAQLTDLERAAEYERWHVTARIRDEGRSGKDLSRPGLARALELIARRRADGLAVAKLDRLSRSAIDTILLAEWFEAADARLVALDVKLDTSTPSGRMVFSMFGVMAEWERATIAQRTRDGLAEVRAKGRPISRPAVVDQPELAARIAEMRQGGMTFQAIADRLNSEGVPTMRGGSEWRVSSVQSAAGYQRPRPRRKTAELPTLTRRAA